MSTKFTILLITTLLILFIAERKKKFHWRYMKLTDQDLKHYNSLGDIDISKPEGFWRSFFITFKLFNPFFKVEEKIKENDEILKSINKNKAISKIYLLLLTLLIVEYFVL